MVIQSDSVDFPPVGALSASFDGRIRFGHMEGGAELIRLCKFV